jgi:tight adherence protein C
MVQASAGKTFVDTIATSLSFRFGAITFGPVETTILVVALAAAVLSAFHLWRIGSQEDRQHRLDALRITAIDRTDPGAARRPRWYDRLGAVVAASRVVGVGEQQRLLNSLAAAGIKGHGGLARFVASKVFCAVLLAALSWAFFQWEQLFAGIAAIRVVLLFGAAMLGWRLPDIVLSRLAAGRRRHLEEGLPDALDLLVICAEAGLSLDQSIEQVSLNMQASNRTVAEEFATTAAEMRVLSSRGEALDNLVRRTGLLSLRSITATLSQAIRFGTPLAESMRVLAAELRTERLMRLEERAARLPVFLAIPMMLFILPAMFMVIGTPVALRILDTLSQVFGVHP